MTVLNFREIPENAKAAKTVKDPIRRHFCELCVLCVECGVWYVLVKYEHVVMP
jgi:hypothetical protein